MSSYFKRCMLNNNNMFQLPSGCNMRCEKLRTSKVPISAKKRFRFNVVVIVWCPSDETILHSNVTRACSISIVVRLVVKAFFSAWCKSVLNYVTKLADIFCLNQITLMWWKSILWNVITNYFVKACKYQLSRCYY